MHLRGTTTLLSADETSLLKNRIPLKPAQPRKTTVLHMKRISQTESLMFVILCVLCLQRQSFFTFILLLCYFTTNRIIFPTVNVPFLSSNIPSAPAYGVYVSQLIRYARACSNYQDFMERGKVLTTKLLSQEYQNTKLVATLKKVYGRHHDLVNPYNVAVSGIANDEP